MGVQGLQEWRHPRRHYDHPEANCFARAQNRAFQMDFGCIEHEEHLVCLQGQNSFLRSDGLGDRAHDPCCGRASHAVRHAWGIGWEHIIICSRTWRE